MTNSGTPEAEYFAYLGITSNPRCPDSSSHSENVYDRLAPNWRSQRPDALLQGQIDEETEAEYLACPGHDC